MKNDPRRYSHDRFDRLIRETVDNIQRLSDLKGGEYAGDDDRLANFRRNAAALDLTMEQVWAVYAAKHWDAVIQYVKDRAAGKDRVRMEGIQGRLDDLIVYAILFKAMEDETIDPPQDYTTMAASEVAERVKSFFPGNNT